MAQILTVTNVQGQLDNKVPLVESAAGTYFQRPSSDVKATVSVGNVPTGPSSTRRLGDSVAAGNQFSFYKLRLEVSCDSSASCGTVSSAMVAAQQEPDQLGRPIGDALGEPLLKSMSAEVQAEVLGDVAPGLQPFAAVREEKLDELPAEKGLDSISLPTWIILAGLAL
eukprot:CAMPEP_0197702138 /NCGR_PEP_ID=MMETSP1338-20131121/124128_1 /TAXON_ID=43686 ORGANISM="Pelagodinium beii, Strain RCC1491" /NCGR_SAMPLE_ID=MMETSP1338 /ASSEMBLY_ACC=CAM_ASM_000754 /LENGTH=167 /DNA_ID=CAMNT_0043285927 /DNA_START=114 /DNA_END=614 /DNA_ORIENTATION=+